ncbi:MAG: hypothetical protein U0O04_02150 [Clostridia bacterium]|jgi:hypothetical protein|nr:unknown [Clostridium sp. CAG:571]DAM81915.1 MAG TPA: hypothetical protein [Caudoviricetes sp.]HJJ06257.1 hypothetical protein [Clostridiaceae bacterium]HJJ14296.1 hypothetical protein [Clostridiaceae bacterium]
MENASKALIIAGSIILAVLIIVLGMYFYNQAVGIGKNINMTEYEIQSYNSKFINYEGKVSGTKARELCDVIKQHNLANSTNKGTGIVVYYNQNYDSSQSFTAVTAYAGLNTQVDSVKQNLGTGKFYEIILIYDSSRGIVSAINFKEL